MDIERGKLPAVISVPLVESPSHQYSVHEHFDLSINTKFLNFSGRTIMMGTRNGVVYPVPPRSDRSYQEFIVRQELYISDNLKTAVRDRLISYDGIESADLKAFKKLFLESYRDQVHGLTLKFDYKVGAAEINHQGGTIYVTELDIILSTRQDNIPLHPFCLEAMSHVPKGIRTISENGLSVIIVDSQETIGPRFIRLMGKIVRIDTIRNSLKPDGVYIAYRGLQDAPGEDLKDVIDFVPASEMNSITWLYKTFAEARNAPDREAEINFELKELEVQGKKIAAVTSTTKSEHDLEKLELERQNAALQRDYDELDRKNKLVETEMNRRLAQEEHQSKMEQMRSKDYYEERSTTRKDTSELVKFIPALLMGAGAAVLAIKTLFSG